MSVISSVSALPNRLHIFLKQLASHPDGIMREKLEEMMSPPSLMMGETANIFLQVLREAMQLDLVIQMETEMGEKRLQIATDIQDLDDKSFLRLIEKRLLSYPMDRSQIRSHFPEALAWFLMQDPLKPFMWDKNVRSIVENDVGDESESFELTNKARFQNLIYWARFLGYAVKLGFTATEISDDTDIDEDESQTADQDAVKATAYVLPDPTTAIARYLPAIFNDKKQLSASELIQAWASFLPVLEGGSIRESLEQQARPELARQDRTFSKATSLGLRRLAQRKIIQLKTLSDADMHLLDYGRETTRVSHIVYLVEQ